MAWDWPEAAQVALESAQRMPAPKPGELFIPLPLESLSEPTQHFSDMQHIHRCAMINIETEEGALQGRIMDYILANERSVPLFMLNDVPMYLAGYKKAKGEMT